MLLNTDWYKCSTFFENCLYKKKDNFVLSVHIADVAHYVKEGGAIDKEAFRRGTSVYFPDYVLPMLPKELSNGICSLNPNEDRLAMCVVMEFDKNGNVVNYDICEGVIRSNYRMTYTEVTKIFDGDSELKKKYLDLRFQMVIGHVDNPMQKKSLRREIATLNTLIRQKEIAGLDK